MALKKKEISPEPSSSAFALPELMAAMAAPQTELPITGLHPAPDEWNFFGKLPDGKFLELCDSVAEHGLIHPLLIWEREDGKRVILSGHNRVRALQALYDSTGDAKYLTAPCAVRRGLTDMEARALLTDANWVQRTLTPSEKARCVARRYSEHGRLPSGGGGRAYDRVAKHFGLKATQVYSYVKIAALPEDVLNHLDSGLLSLRAAALLAKLPTAELEALREKLSGHFDTESVMDALKPRLYETLSFHVPIAKTEEVRRAVELILAK